MRLTAIVAAGALCACGERPAPPVETAQGMRELSATTVPATPEPVLPPVPVATDPVRTSPPARSVRVVADPPPPFTYWAPEGATIRNHGNPGIWVAYVQGRQVGMYFGDDCGASGFQHWIDMPLDQLPRPANGEQARVFAVNEPVTADLRPDRLNVAYDPKTRRVHHVSCG